MSRRYLLLALLFAALFAGIAAVALRPQPSAFDLSLRESIHTLASHTLTSCMKFVTDFGGGWFLWPLGLLACLVLLFRADRRDAVFFAITVVGAKFLYESMKLLFHRLRPDPFFHHPKPDSFSFPSGHAFLSLCFYLALAEILIDPLWPESRKRAIRFAAMLLILVIGFSRVYLGVHYPTDVLGGYAAALAWWALVRAVQLSRR